MAKRRFTKEQLDALLEDSEVTETKPWRHGHLENHVFEFEGVHWLVTVPVHSDEGYQLHADHEAVAVAQVLKHVTVWEPIKEAAQPAVEPK